MFAPIDQTGNAYGSLRMPRQLEKRADASQSESRRVIIVSSKSAACSFEKALCVREHRWSEMLCQIQRKRNLPCEPKRRLAGPGTKNRNASLPLPNRYAGYIVRSTCWCGGGLGTGTLIDAHRAYKGEALVGRGPRGAPPYLLIKSPDQTRRVSCLPRLRINCEALSRLLDLGLARGCYPNRNRPESVVC